ncbi:MAG: hypothetical protein SPJ34_01010, partial [Candidatus Ornithospirochaeta sp.]|nr:hypothetical protein [Candidatus Ornithospirochaeta sp.]
QESFKIVVETKMTDWFSVDQLMRHLNSFGDENYKVIITLASELMDERTKSSFDAKLKEYNEKQSRPVIHINTTFESLANAISDVLDDRDYEMQDVLSDYMNYCYNDNLIPVSDSWKYMRMRLSGKTFDFSVNSNVYFDNAEHGFRAHDTIGLYKNKSIRAIGKIIARITAVEKEKEIEFMAEYGDLTEGRKEIIRQAMDYGDSQGYDLRNVEHRYFFVEKFYETDFKKASPRAPMGSRVFDLTEVMGTDQLPDIEQLAEDLKDKSWT